MFISWAILPNIQYIADVDVNNGLSCSHTLLQHLSQPPPLSILRGKWNIATGLQGLWASFTDISCYWFRNIYLIKMFAHSDSWRQILIKYTFMLAGPALYHCMQHNLCLECKLIWNAVVKTGLLATESIWQGDNCPSHKETVKIKGIIILELASRRPANT